MGYTVYWEFKKNIKKSDKALAIETVNRYIYEYTQSRRKTPESLSGDSAHKPDLKTHIFFNGKQDQKYEGFYIKDFSPDDLAAKFCKTNRNNYTLPVLVSLKILKVILKNKFSYRTDDGVDSENPDTLKKCFLYNEVKNEIKNVLENISSEDPPKDPIVDVPNIMSKLFS